MREGGDERTSSDRHVCIYVCMLGRLSGDLSPLPRGVVNVGEE